MQLSLVSLLTILSISPSLVSCRPIPFSWSKIQAIRKREVPQEHSHEHILTTVRASLDTNNPAGIVDPVFGLLGNAAAADGLGTITDVECLQQATADQAFTNAKAAGDIEGMTRALVYRTLERNTGAVGLASNQCTTITAVNPEIAALSQHQDPASTGAAATNKAIALKLAIQIASIGGNTTEAIDSGTFEPGTIGDPTAAGHTCDNQDDANGCIFTQNLLVPDVTVEEIAEAIASASISSSTSTTSAATTSSTTSTTDDSSTGVVTVTVTASVCAVSSSSATTTTLAAVVSSTSVTSTSSAVVATSTVSFGTCDPPLISASNSFSDHEGIFAFEPTNTVQYNHGSALQIAIITDFMCDNLVNVCGLKTGDPGVTLCNTAEAAVGSGTGNGALADKWNAFFGASTDFVDAAGSTGASSVSSSAVASTTAAATSTTTSVAASSTSASTTTSAISTATSAALATGSLGITDFGSCSAPLISAGINFTGHEGIFAFEPTNLTSYNHGSALNIEITASVMCDDLIGVCGLSDTSDAFTACQTQSALISGDGDGSLADKWNALWGATTDFQNTEGSTTSTLIVNIATVSFGSCGAPLISAGTDFVGHEGIFAYQPTNTADFGTGNALNIGILTGSLCNALVNDCGLTAIEDGFKLCSEAAALVGDGENDGGLADQWNAIFGVQTNFASTTGSTETNADIAATTVSGFTGGPAPTAPVSK